QAPGSPGARVAGLRVRDAQRPVSGGRLFHVANRAELPVVVVSAAVGKLVAVQQADALARELADQPVRAEQLDSQVAAIWVRRTEEHLDELDLADSAAARIEAVGGR